jgi:hypothetical protein
MTGFLRIAAALAATLSFSAMARADMGPGFLHTPRPTPVPVRPKNAVQLVIEASDDATEARLTIPRRLLRSAKAVEQKSRADGGSISVPWTLVACTGLTLALAIAGLGLSPFRHRPAAWTVALVVGLAAGMGIGCRLASAAEPPPANRFEVVAPGLPLDKVKVEVLEKGDAVRLIVPRTQLAETARRLKEAGKKTP